MKRGGCPAARSLSVCFLLLLSFSQPLPAAGQSPSPPVFPRAPRLGILPNPVTGGQTTIGLLTVDQTASSGEVVVALASGNPAVAVVPTLAIVPAGAERTLVSIVTFPVTQPTAVTLTVTGPGGSRPVTLQVLPFGTSPATGNLLVNGSFETPRVPSGTPDTLPLRTPDALPGWRITRGTVDVTLAPAWESAPGEGRQSLDLTGTPGAGAIEQSLPTVPGREYLFTGWIAHHPDNPVAPEGRANVFLNGQFFVQLFHRDARATRTALRWTPFSYRFQATAATTTLALVDVTRSWETGGIFLDGLAVVPAQTNLLVNGGFEEPLIPAGAPHLVVGSDGLPGWRLAQGGAVLVAPYRWQPAPGRSGQMLHLLNPFENPRSIQGVIEQSFPTEPGRLYTLTGWLSHNPYRPEGRVAVILNGEPVAEILHTTALFGPLSETELRWQPFQFAFRATGTTTSLQFADVTRDPNAEGAVIDGLAVMPAEAPIPGQAPAAPSGLLVRLISPTQIDLAWTDTSGDETAFEIERREGSSTWTRIALIAQSSTRFSDFGVHPATTYSYRVRAVNDAGSSAWSNEAGGMTLGGP